MQLHFTGRNIDVTPALKSYTQEKLQRLERRHANVSQVYVTFHVENVTHIAEATVHFDGTEIHASAQSTDMYAAVDELIDKLIAQITKHKEKVSQH